MKGIFDPPNFVQCGEDTIKAWDMLKDYIYYMHIKDATLDGCIVPAGLGDGNIAYLKNAFIKQGGKAFTMEPHLTVFSGLENLEQSGNTSEVGKKYTFDDNNTAFDAGCNAFKKLL